MQGRNFAEVAAKQRCKVYEIRTFPGWENGDPGGAGATPPAREMKRKGSLEWKVEAEMK